VEETAALLLVARGRSAARDKKVLYRVLDIQQLEDGLAFMQYEQSIAGGGGTRKISALPLGSQTAPRTQRSQ